MVRPVMIYQLLRRGTSSYTTLPRRNYATAIATAAAPPTAYSTKRPSGVGILAADIYFPKRYVKQSELEKFDGIDAGRYTIGLGQEKMAFAGPEEDINSMCLNALNQLMTKYNIQHRDIGFLAVGTETLVDKSKSTKTVLMKDFAENGNTDIEGVTSTNACYGGTASLFHGMDWVESSAWDGRYGIVLAGDIAVYAKGNARPTGGAGVIAMLIGPNAPIVLEPGLRASHFEDVYDFYKPNMLSEYPLVDGPLSNSCYIRSIDRCFQLYADKFQRKYGERFLMNRDVQHAVFHQPYQKLVQKSFARLAYNEMLRDPENPAFKPIREAASTVKSEEDSYTNKALEKACMSLTKKDYESKVFPSTFGGRNLGNLYAGSTYAGILSLLAASGDELLGKRAMVFSYGSGLAATMFSLRFENSVEYIRRTCDLHRRLEEERVESTPLEFTAALELRERFCSGEKSVEKDSSFIPSGGFYLAEVDNLGRRSYAQTPALSAAATTMKKKQTA